MGCVIEAIITSPKTKTKQINLESHWKQQDNQFFLIVQRKKVDLQNCDVLYNVIYYQCQFGDSKSLIPAKITKMW